MYDQKLKSFDGSKFRDSDVSTELLTYKKKVKEVVCGFLDNKSALPIQVSRIYDDLENLTNELNSFVDMFVQRGVYVVDADEAVYELSSIENCIRDFNSHMGLNNDDVLRIARDYGLNCELTSQLREVRQLSWNIQNAVALCLRTLEYIRKQPLKISSKVEANGELVYYGEMCFVGQSDAERFRLTQYTNMWGRTDSEESDVDLSDIEESDETDDFRE